MNVYMQVVLVGLSILSYVSHKFTLGLSILYVYVYIEREYCLQVIIYPVSAKGTAEHITIFIILSLLLRQKFIIQYRQIVVTFHTVHTQKELIT